MSCPIQHAIPVSGLIPLYRRYMDYQNTNLLFHDYFVEKYKRLGITRDEMMCIMPSLMNVDVLSGCDKLIYIGENVDDKTDEKSNINE